MSSPNESKIKQFVRIKNEKTEQVTISIYQDGSAYMVGSGMERIYEGQNAEQSASDDLVNMGFLERQNDKTPEISHN